MEDYLSQVGETAMDKRKVKPPGGAEKASGDEQQGGGAEQEESIVKDGTNRKLQQDVNQLQQRLKYAEQLEERNLKLTTEERKHEQEKQLMKAEIQQLQHKASVSRPYTRGYEHEQKLQEMVKRYEREYNEQLEENGRLQEKISQIEKGMCEDTVVTHIDDIGDSDLKVELKKKEQHIHALQTQVESLQQFSKGQSRQVLQLKQELEALKVCGPILLYVPGLISCPYSALLVIILCSACWHAGSALAERVRQQWQIQRGFHGFHGTLFRRAAFENTMRKHTMYTTLTL